MDNSAHHFPIAMIYLTISSQGRGFSSIEVVRWMKIVPLLHQWTHLHLFMTTKKDESWCAVRTDWHYIRNGCQLLRERISCGKHYLEREHASMCLIFGICFLISSTLFPSWLSEAWQGRWFEDSNIFFSTWRIMFVRYICSIQRHNWCQDVSSRIRRGTVNILYLVTVNFIYLVVRRIYSLKTYYGSNSAPWISCGCNVRYRGTMFSLIFHFSSYSLYIF